MNDKPNLYTMPMSQPQARYTALQAMGINRQKICLITPNFVHAVSHRSPRPEEQLFFHLLWAQVFLEAVCL